VQGIYTEQTLNINPEQCGFIPQHSVASVQRFPICFFVHNSFGTGTVEDGANAGNTEIPVVGKVGESKDCLVGRLDTGYLVGRRNTGCLVGRRVTGCFVGALIGCLVGFRVGGRIGCLVSARIGYLVGLIVGGSLGCLVGALIGCLVGLGWWTDWVFGLCIYGLLGWFLCWWTYWLFRWCTYW
jgi:hypothetical protein